MAKASITTPSWRFTAGLGALACFLFALLGLGVAGTNPATASAASCPNESIREAQTSETLPGGTTSFPACMALEMVSPQKKFNQYAKDPDLGAGGDRVKFASLAALAETPKQGSLADPYIATRTASGWVTEATATPPQYSVGYVSAAIPCAYSPDLSRWATFASTEAQARLVIATAFRGGLGGLFEQISPTLAPFNVPVETFGVFNGVCPGASTDASHLFFSTGDTEYLPGDPATGGVRNVYEAYLDGSDTPSVALLQRDKDGILYGGRCAAQVGGRGSRGAVSPDASRVYFSTRPGQTGEAACDTAANKLRILERIRTPEGLVITEPISSECTRVAPPCSTTDGDDVYQGASQEGTKVLFTTTRQLADSDKDATADLYLYDDSRPAGERLTQLSAGDGTDPTPGEGAEVLGVPDFGGDGSHAYFVAEGVLTTTANQAGKTAQAGQPNLYLCEYPAGRTAFIGTLASADSSAWIRGPGLNDATAVPTLGPDPEDQSVGGDGHILVFQTVEPLLAGEDSDAGSRDDYRYDADSGSLELLTKAMPGGSGNEALDVDHAAPGAANPIDAEPGPQALSFGRWVSEKGNVVAFVTKEGLDPADTNGKSNAYIWREGEVTAIPFGEKPTVSMAGNEVAFVSDKQLLPEDGDGAKDVYLLRVDGGFKLPTPPPPCAGEACQGPPSPQPVARAFASASSGPGNSLQPPPCKKGFARKHGRCVKSHRKANKHPQHHKRPAGHEQGGRK